MGTWCRIDHARKKRGAFFVILNEVSFSRRKIVFIYLSEFCFDVQNETAITLGHSKFTLNAIIRSLLLVKCGFLSIPKYFKYCLWHSKASKTSILKLLVFFADSKGSWVIGQILFAYSSALIL